MNVSRRSLLILAFGVVVGCGRWSQPDAVPFRVGVATYPGFGAGYVALAKGFFEGVQPEFVIIDDFAARHSAFLSGSTQATISTLDSYPFESAGVTSKVVLVIDESAGADAIIVRPDISSITDLKGRKVAFTRGSPSHFLLLSALASASLSASDIVPIEVDDPSRAGEAFLSGAVDAAVTWEPNVSQIVESGRGRVLLSTAAKPGLIVDVLLVGQSAAENRSAEVRSLVSGWLKGVDYIRSNPSEAHAIIAKAFGIPAEELPGMVAGLRYADYTRNLELLNTSPASERPAAAEIMARAVAFWRSAGLTNNDLDVNQILTSEFIRR